jgi:hypothetical protein
MATAPQPACLQKILAAIPQASGAKYPTPEQLFQIESAAVQIAAGAELFQLIRELLAVAAHLSELDADPQAARAFAQLIDRLAYRLEMLARREGGRLEESARAARRMIDDHHRAVAQASLKGLVKADAVGVGIRRRGKH